MAKGSTDYFEDSRNAAHQAALDVAAYTRRQASSGAAEDWTTAATVALAVFAAAQLGVSIANLVLSRFPVTPDTPETPPNDAFQIEVVNNTTVPVVPFAWEPAGGDIARVPPPLAPGARDLLLLTNTNDGFDTDTKVKLAMLVGHGGDESQVELVVRFDYTDTGTPGRWRVVAGIDTDGDPVHSFDKSLEIVGATFTAATGTSYPSFSFYSACTETGTGTVALVLYDKAAPAA